MCFLQSKRLHVCTAARDRGPAAEEGGGRCRFCVAFPCVECKKNTIAIEKLKIDPLTMNWGPKVGPFAPKSSKKWPGWSGKGPKLGVLGPQSSQFRVLLGPPMALFGVLTPTRT